MNASKQALAALALYAILAAIFVWHGASLTRELSGQGADPLDSCWFLAWWPFALTHHLDPLFTQIIWYPTGVSLAWVTSVPLLALLGWPVTVLAGPVLTYNLYIVTAPVFAAWFAYLLCHHLTQDFRAALIGGFLFGFSSYEMAQSTGALNLTIIFCVPALLLVVLKRLDDELSRKQAVALAAIILLTQFLICIEIFALLFVFGGIGWALGYLYLPERRAALRRLFVDGLCTAPFVALPLLPLFISMARHYTLINHPAAWPYYFTADLLNVFIPSALNILGTPFVGFSGHFNGGVVQEQDAYLSLPLILLLVLFTRGQGGTPRGRFLLACFFVLLVCEFGPLLWIAGHCTLIALPWMVMMHLPLLSSALAVRFTMFTALAAGIIAAYWVASPKRRAWCLLAVLACVALLPQPHPWRAPPYSSFFAPGRVQQALGLNPRLLILPFAGNGPSSFWQMQNDFGFTEVGGYLGFPPKPAQSYKAVGEMFGNVTESDFLTEFVRYAQTAGAQYVVAGPGANPAMVSAVSSLDWPTQKIDDVTVFTVPLPYHE
jgi:hypothetical protein